MRSRIRQKRLILSFFSVLFFLIASLASPLGASAHARLLKSTPEAGAHLDAQPAEIQLFLSESIDISLSSIKVLDRARKEQAVGPLSKVGNDDNSGSAPITARLAPGTYTVVWKMLSAADGHVTSGSFAFRIRDTTGGSTGTPEAEEPIVPVAGSTDDPNEGNGDTPDALRWVVRAILLGAFALLLGGPIIAVLVVEPTVGERGDAAKALWPVVGRRFARIGAIVAGVLILCLVLDLLLQVSSITGGGIFDALGRHDLALQVLNSTRYGFTWVLKIIAAVLLLVMMLGIWQWNRRGGTGLWELAVAVASLGVLGQSLGSHSAAVDAAHGGQIFGLPLPIIADWLHLVMVSAWVGGLGYLMLVLLPSFKRAGMAPEERRAFLGRSIPRFSRVAIFSTAILAITGTYMVILHSNDLGDILGTFYGQVLALKVGLFGALVALGAINLRRLTPRLLGKSEQVASAAPADGGSVRMLGRNIRVEVGLAMLAILCAGGLTLLPPPTGAGAVAVATSSVTPSPAATAVAEISTALPTPKPVNVDTSVSGYSFSLTTRPSVDGDDLTLVINRGVDASAPLTDVTKVLFKVTPQDVDAGGTSYPATLQGEASPVRQTWKLTESILTLDGSYLVTAIVQRSVAPDMKAAFLLNLSEDKGLQGSVGQVIDVILNTDPSPPISGTVTLTISLVDGEHKPVDGAKVTISPLMPAHAHISPNTVAQPVPGKPGMYTAQAELDMGGGWLFIFDIERNGLPPLKTDASLDVIDPNATPTP